MYSAGFFGRRYSLNPVNSAFILYFLKYITVALEGGAPCFYFKNYLFKSSQFSGAGIQSFQSPALSLRILGVHPQELSRKQGGFLPARPGPYFNDGCGLGIP